MPTWNEKVQAWQAKEKAELGTQHKETMAAMKALAKETQMRHKQHIAMMKASHAEHGTGPKSTFSSAGGGNKTR